MLKKRIITALFLLLTLIAATTLVSSFYFALLIAVVTLLAAWEWSGFIGLDDRASRIGYLVSVSIMIFGLFILLGITPTTLVIDELRVGLLLGLGLLFWILILFVIAAYPENKTAWNDKSKIACMGLFALIPAWVGMVQLKYLMPSGFLVQSLIVMVAAVDVGAYFVGMKFGKTKLAEALSPKKTWEGVWGGMATCVLVSGCAIWFYHNYYQLLSFRQLIFLLALAIFVTFFSVIGDLFESMLKRNRQLKDSGSVLPGHGGILDRVDGLVAVTPIYVLSISFVVARIG